MKTKEKQPIKQKEGERNKKQTKESIPGHQGSLEEIVRKVITKHIARVNVSKQKNETKSTPQKDFVRLTMYYTIL